MDNKLNQQNKELVWDFWQKMNYLGFGNIEKVFKSRMHKIIKWFGPLPINNLQAVEEVIDRYRKALYVPFPNLKRKCDVFPGSVYRGKY